MSISLCGAEMRSINEIRIISLLRKGALTRRELQQLTSLSWGCVTNTVNRLIAAGYVKEDKIESRRTSGRTPCIVKLRDDDNLIIGIDVNGTGLSGCVMSLAGTLVTEKYSPADYSSKDALLSGIFNMMTSLLNENPSAHHLAAGISMQGEVDSAKGISVKLAQVSGWENVPLCSIIADRFSLPCFIAHDPDCMLHACKNETEITDGILLRMDTDVGMAAVTGGRMLSGCGLLETGHMIIDPNGPYCSCGARGCLSAYLAGSNTAAIADALTVAAHNLIQLFRPDTLILTGELINDHPEFTAAFESKFKENARHGSVSIVALTDTRSAMRGAALIAVESILDSADIYRHNTGGESQ